MHAVIQAGGKGTRLSSVTKNEIPKPMAEIAGKPLLLWQIECLKSNGVLGFTIITGYLGHVIKEYFGDGTAFGTHIDYIEEDAPLGTAGALYYLRGRDIGEDFLLVYGDVIFDIDIVRMMNFHKSKNAIVTLFAHPNSHPYDSDLVVLDDEAKVLRFDSKNNNRTYWYDNLVNAGFFVLNKAILNEIPTPSKLAFEEQVICGLIEKGGNVCGYRSPEYIRDAGTIDRYESVGNDITSGLVAARNLKNKQRCVFIDRDGTLTKFNGLVFKPEQLELGETAAEAIKMLNQLGYLAVLITNQPVVARGLCSMDDVREIHNKLSTLLGKHGAYLDDMAFCPHHPDKGYPEENPDYKVDCQCRKPKTGMIDAFVAKYNIDVSKSWFIGDTTVDIMTGINAKLKTALVKTGEAGSDKKYNVKSDIECADILDAVENIVKEAHNGYEERYTKIH